MIHLLSELRSFARLRGARAAAAGFALALAVAGCSKVHQDLAGGRVNAFTQPHVLRYVTEQDIGSLNPWFDQSFTVNELSQLTMAWLYRYDAHNRPMPELATALPTQGNGGISADGRTIIFHLRRGVVWSDGAPFRADDVVFSFHQYLNPRNNVVSRQGWDEISAISEPDRYSVKLRLRHPYAEFEPTFFSTGGANPCILPKHLLAREKEINNVAYNSLPVGIGPFKYARWNRADSVVLVPNPFYFKGSPKLRRIVFRFIPDRNVLVEQLQGGTADLWVNASPYYLDRLRALQGYRVTLQPSYSFGHMDFNLSHPALADARVREALRDATDRRYWWKQIAHRVGILQESYLPPTYPNAPPVIPLIPYSVDKAERLLNEAGWRRGQDGIRAKNGVKLRLDVALGPASPDVDDEVELLRGWWQQLGVAIDVQHYPSPLLFGPFQQHGIINSGKFDIAMFTWGIDALDNSRDTLGCDSVPPYGQNDTHYCNQEMDRLIKQFNETYDPAKQKLLKAKMMQIFVHDVPMFVTSVHENIGVANLDLKGFHPNTVSPFDDMMNVDI